MLIHRLENNEPSKTEGGQAGITVDMADARVVGSVRPSGHEDAGVAGCVKQKLHDDAEFLPMPDCFNGPPSLSGQQTRCKDSDGRYPTMVPIDKLVWAPPVDKSKFFPPPIVKQAASNNTANPETGTGTADATTPPDSAKSKKSASDESNTVNSNSVAGSNPGKLLPVFPWERSSY